jgi:hypothetical protein
LKGQVVTRRGNAPYTKREKYKHSDSEYELITRNGKIVVPKTLQLKGTEWYHLELLHPGETRMELTIGQHYYWKHMRETIQKVCKACTVCKRNKSHTKKFGHVPAKTPETIPWHTLCIDLIGPYKIGKIRKPKDPQETRLHCLTMIDPATSWFEIVEIPDKTAHVVANLLEITWLSRYPWPTEIVMDRGKEFRAEVEDAIKHQYGIRRKVITTRNPQANAMVERAHQTIATMLRTSQVKSVKDLDAQFGWTGILAAVRHAMNATVHTTLRATPTQLVFGRDCMLNVSFEANWQYIKNRKQRIIIQNNDRENATRISHTYNINDKVMVKQHNNRKYGTDKYEGPYTVTHVYENGTVRLMQATNRGAVYSTWNIRNLHPCEN